MSPRFMGGLPDFKKLRLPEHQIPHPGSRFFISSQAIEPPVHVQAVTVVWLETGWLYWVRAPEGWWLSAGHLIRYPEPYAWTQIGRLDAERRVREDLRDITSWYMERQKLT